jgi:glycosyltransferase involved in cell wall biosynthesis
MSENLLRKKPEKIALFMIAPLTQGGGAEKYFINLAQNLSRHEDMEADVITFDDKSFRGFARLLHIFARGNFFGKIADYDKGMREKREDIESNLGAAHWHELPRKKIGTRLNSYDLIYAKNELADLFLLKMIGYKKLPPIVVGVHTPITYPETKSLAAKIHNFLYSGFFYKWLLRDAKCIHVSNQAAKDIIEKKFKLRSELAYYPFSIRKIDELKQKIKCKIEFDSSKKNIIFVGRLSKQKGIDILINTILEIHRNNYISEKICLNIFGSGDATYENKLSIFSGKYSFVRYFGHIENKYIPDILSRQNLMLAPSRWETLPYSILEAQAMGVPVIAFDIPGPADIIENDRTGFLVNSEKVFFEKIKNIIEDKISFEKNEIIRNIENKFDPEKTSHQMFQMFQDNMQNISNDQKD